jgi:hypothetical protein
MELTKNKHREEHRYGAGKAFLNVFLCIVFFIIFSSALLLNLVMVSTSDEAILETVLEIDAAVLIEELEITDIILASINSEILEAHDIQQSSLERLLEHPSVKEFLSDSLSEYFSALSQGDSDFTLSEKDIIRFLENNESEIQNAIGYRLTETDYQNIEAYLGENEFLKDMSVESILPGADINPDLFKWALSTNTFVLLLILCAGVLLSLFILNRKHLHITFLSIGVTLCVLGLVYTILGLLLPSIILTVTEGIIKLGLARSILSYALSSSLSYGLIILAIGIMFTGVYVLSRYKRRYNSPIYLRSYHKR